MTRLALIRHGHTPWNRAGRIQGRTDIPLDEDAKTSLGHLTLPPPWDKAVLVASPLARAIQTAELIANRTPQSIPQLIEMDWGAWEGKRGEDLLADDTSGYRHIEEWGWQYRPPGGESPQEVLDRLMPWVLSLSGDTVAICHIGIMRVMMAKATGWNFEGPAPFRIKRNRLFVLEIHADQLSVSGEPIRLEENAT